MGFGGVRQSSWWADGRQDIEFEMNWDSEEIEGDVRDRRHMGRRETHGTRNRHPIWLLQALWEGI